MRKLVSYFLILTLLFIYTAPVLADELSDAMNKQNAIQEELEDLQQKKNKEEKKLKDAQEQKEDVEEKKEKVDKEYKKLQEQLDMIYKQIEENSKSLKEAEERYNEQKELVRKRFRIMYKNSNTSYLQTLIESKSLGDFLSRLRIVKLISKSDKCLVESLKTAKQDLEHKKALKEAELGKMKGEAQKTEERKRDLSLSREKLADEINQRKELIELYESEIEKEIKRSKELESIIRKLQDKSRKYNGAKMLWPAPGSYTITSEYGMRWHPILGKRKLHTGVDIGASYGESILAVNDGVVIFAGYQNGYGKTVIIDHGGGISTLYAHCSKILIGSGEEVKAGKVIAKVGSTGWSTGPHLHFEVRKDGVTQDPMKGYLKK